jgi:transcriptional regulator with XRE-family HTH domain
MPANMQASEIISRYKMLSSQYAGFPCILAFVESTLEPKAVPSVAELLDNLFKTRTKLGGKEYSYQEVSDGLNGELDPTYIAKIRKGRITNPGRNTLLLLCRFFQVPATYFFPELDLQPVSEDLADEQLDEALARRAAKLTPEARRHLAALLDILQK